jgi:hypothetical protein
MAASRAGKRMRSMTKARQRYHCVDAIAAVNCTLQAALGRFERCPGVRCPFWDRDECLLRGVKPELLARPRVAEHLLEVRDSLAALRDGETGPNVRSRFHRLLNEEQEWKPTDGSRERATAS